MDEQTFQNIAQQHKLGHVANKIFEISEDCIRIYLGRIDGYMIDHRHITTRNLSISAAF